jgi:hypothetical protein
MLILYKYIFFKAYNFCIRVFKEKDFPWFFASGTVSMTVTMTIILALQLLRIIALPTEINTYGEYQGYCSLALLGGTVLYVRYKNKYLRIIDECKGMPANKSKVLLYLSISYFIFLIIGLFLTGLTLREYHGF